MEYSVVLPVYAGDNPEWFRLSAQSVLDQTEPSDDVVVVADGPLPPGLAAAVSDLAARHPEVSVLADAAHHGAGPARNRGVAAARNEIVAVQDADDISTPERMALLLAALAADPALALVGGQLAEFGGDDPANITSYRRVPLEMPDIRRFAARRMPVNGPTLMFRKADVLAVGGYGASTRSEDYLLISRLLAAGKRIANVDEVVLLYRGGHDAMARRRTWRHFREFVATRVEVHRLGIGTWADVAIPCLAQLAITITPPAVTRALYARLLRARD